VRNCEVGSTFQEEKFRNLEGKIAFALFYLRLNNLFRICGIGQKDCRCYSSFGFEENEHSPQARMCSKVTWATKGFEDHGLAPSFIRMVIDLALVSFFRNYTFF
jgi:hypothetical protein